MYKDYTVKKNEDGSETRTTIMKGPGFKVIYKVTDYPEDKIDDFEDLIDMFDKRIYKCDKCDKEEEIPEDIFDRIQIKKVEKAPKSASKKDKSEDEFASKIAEIMGDDSYNSDVFKDAIDAMVSTLEDYDKDELSKLSDNLFTLLSDKAVAKKIFDVLIKANRKIEG